MSSKPIQLASVQATNVVVNDGTGYAHITFDVRHNVEDSIEKPINFGQFIIDSPSLSVQLISFKWLCINDEEGRTFYAN